MNADEVVDYDGVVDALDNFTEGLKKVREHSSVVCIFAHALCRTTLPHIH